jgi:hypothetical protein
MMSILPKSAVLSNLLFGGLFHQVLPTGEQVRPLPVIFGEGISFVVPYGGIALLLTALLFRMTALSLPMLAGHRGEAANADSAVRSAMTSGLPGRKKQPSTLRSSCWMLAQRMRAGVHPPRSLPRNARGERPTDSVSGLVGRTRRRDDRSGRTLRKAPCSTRR